MPEDLEGYKKNARKGECKHHLTNLHNCNIGYITAESWHVCVYQIYTYKILSKSNPLKGLGTKLTSIDLMQIWWLLIFINQKKEPHHKKEHVKINAANMPNTREMVDI